MKTIIEPVQLNYRIILTPKRKYKCTRHDQTRDRTIFGLILTSTIHIQSTRPPLDDNGQNESEYGLVSSPVRMDRV